MSKAPKGLPEDCKETLFALTNVLTPQTEDLVIDDLQEKIQRDANRMILEFPKLMRWGFIIGIRFFEWLPFIFGFGLSRFSKLSPKHQNKYVAGWAFSRIIAKREFFKTLRAFVMLVFFCDERAWEYVGYDPEPHLKQRIQMRKDMLAQHEPKSEVGGRRSEDPGERDENEVGIRYKV